MEGKIVILIVLGVFAAIVVGTGAVFFGRIFWARRSPQTWTEFERRADEKRKKIANAETERIRLGKASWAGRFFGAAFFLIGFYVVALAGWQIYEIGRGQFWTKTECAILSSSVGRSGSASRPASWFRPQASYLYAFGGQNYQGSRVDLPNSSYFSRDAAQAAMANYPAGANVACYVNSENPQESVLDRSVLRFPFSQNGLGLLATFGLGGCLLYASRRRQPKMSAAK